VPPLSAAQHVAVEWRLPSARHTLPRAPYEVDIDELGRAVPRPRRSGSRNLDHTT
jgi:hypothetical protein